MKPSRFSFRDFLGFLPAFLPLGIAVVLLLSLTLLIFGNFSTSPINQRSVGAKYERNLIEKHLEWAGYRESKVDNLVAVSLTQKDLANVKIQSSDLEQNTDIDTYYHLIENILKQEPKEVIVNWNPAVEPTKEESEKLNLLFQEYPKKVYIFASPRAHDNAKKFFDEFATVKISEFCSGDYFLICPYDKKWSFWNIIELLNNHNTGFNAKHTSSNLSVDFSAFLLRLSNPSRIPEIPFSDITSVEHRQTDNGNLLRSKIVFVGNNLTQGIEGMQKPYETGRVTTANIQKNEDVRLKGTPIHIFWAQITSMFQDGDFVSISSPLATSLINISMGISSLITSIFLGPFFGIIFLFCTAILSNLLNILILKHFNYYTPIFSGLYLSGILFILGGFLRLITENILERFSLMKERNIAEKTDLKVNFISLISHNLNTPVAKMISLMDLAKKEVSESYVRSHLAPSLYMASEIQLSVRAVLATNRLEDQRINFETITPKTLCEEVNYEVIPLLKRMKIQLNVDDDSENETAPFKLDRKIITPLISAFTYLLTDDKPNSSKTFFMSIKYNEEDGRLTLEWTTSNKDPKINQTRSQGDFIDEACFALYDTFVKNFKTLLKVAPEQGGDGFNISLVIEKKDSEADKTI